MFKLLLSERRYCASSTRDRIQWPLREIQFHNSQSHVDICSTEIWFEEIQRKNKFYHFVVLAIMKMEEYGSDREI